MINLDKQDLLKQLSQQDYEQWCHDLMIIKRVVTEIASFKKFRDIFDSREYYYFPSINKTDQDSVMVRWGGFTMTCVIWPMIFSMRYQWLEI